MSADALHESAHAVVAHRLGVIVVHAIAEGDNPHVRTRSPWGSDATKVETLQRQAIIDLAGAAIEDQGSDAASADIKNAIARCGQIIELVGRGDAHKLIAGLSERAAKIVAGEQSPMSPSMVDDPKHWRDRAARMQALAIKMAGSLAAILMNDLAIHYEELADQAALKGNSPPNGKRR